jgi:3-isopropylmalate dehydratase
MPVPVPPPRTLYDKIWDDHVMYATYHDARQVLILTLPCSDTNENGLSLIYIDRSVIKVIPLDCANNGISHLVHEVTSPQAFEGLLV